ncbi:HAMP domain-containing histidine kinase [Sphingomonas sp. PL-96]|uniref:sensor histidine kinase n=1 Tax=Sphingomonas sp. PL-96 TaxID=2887201 RepID=UPI001E4EEB26|nr:HAMP domain-containing sensor histidine kinase [Sphingomonas sp. PL-96]MCC2977805.1 HAMP domain-containing histidine kinase [Sphingomonas sp. PL-96]
MASDTPLRWRRAVGRLASGSALVVTGAVLVVAWQNGWWATLLGAALCAAWIAAVGGWSALHGVAANTAIAAPRADARPLPLRSLLDQVPVPLVRTNEGSAHAINRAARTLFGTDDRILSPPSALLRGSSRRLRHEGRSWRVDAVDTAPGERLAVLIDVGAEERAAESRAGDEMIDILGHELLNGLSPVVSLADSAVTAAAQGDTALPDILATLARRVEGLEGFTRAYRTLSRLPDPVVRPVPLDQLFDDLARLFASRFGEMVALDIGVPPGRIVQVDRDQFTQALWALLQNGAEAALAGSPPRRVALTIAAAPELAIRVADTGSGIAAPDRSRIFRPFFTTKPHGSGIGLSLARRIARAHDGDLRLLPTMPTTFEITFLSARE